jgi:hypothetical protein
MEAENNVILINAIVSKLGNSVDLASGKKS